MNSDRAKAEQAAPLPPHVLAKDQRSIHQLRSVVIDVNPIRRVVADINPKGKAWPALVAASALLVGFVLVGVSFTFAMTNMVAFDCFNECRDHLPKGHGLLMLACIVFLVSIIVLRSCRHANRPALVRDLGLWGLNTNLFAIVVFSLFTLG